MGRNRENSNIAIAMLEQWQFDKSIKIISYFETTNNIFVNCSLYKIFITSFCWHPYWCEKWVMYVRILLLISDSFQVTYSIKFLSKSIHIWMCFLNSHKDLRKDRRQKDIKAEFFVRCRRLFIISPQFYILKLYKHLYKFLPKSVYKWIC